MEKKIKFMQGNAACAEGALYAGCKFFAGYPITPSSEIAELLARRLPEVGGRFIQMEDEIAAMASIIGASLTGTKSLTATSGPGFSLKQENIGYACITEIPCVIVNVMRGGPSTGAPTGPSQADIMQARWGTHGDHPVIATAPASVQETFYETVRAFNLSEKYRTPVILMLDEIVGHMREKITFPNKGELEIFDRIKPDCKPNDYKPYDRNDGLIPKMANFGDGYRYHVTGLNHDDTGFPTNKPELIDFHSRRIMDKIEKNVDDIFKYEEYMMDDAEICILSFGSSARPAKVAVNQLRKDGLRAGLFKLITVWPFCEDHFEKIAKRIKKLVVAEMNLGQLVYEAERFIDRKNVIRINRIDSEPISPKQIIDKIKEIKL